MSSLPYRRCRASLLAAVLLFAGAPLTAQQITITPFAGAMVSAQPFLVDHDYYTGLSSGSHSIFGLRLSRPLSPRIALDLGGGVGTGTSKWWDDTESRVLFADLRGRFLIAGRDAEGATALNLLVGGGWTRYASGEIEYKDQQNELNAFGTPTGVAGLQFRLRRARLGTIELEVVDRIHAAGIEGDGVDIPNEDRLLQHDVAITLGYVLQL